jgi:hypothetical protein
MAHQRIYKNLNVRDESTWGVSVTGTNQPLMIRSTSLGLNTNKQLVEETVTSIKGRDRMTIGRNEIDGDISLYADPRNLHHAFEWVNGTQGTSSAQGTSAIMMTYNQNVDGNYLSKTVIMDRNNTQEAFYGVRATKLGINWSDNLVELNLSTMAKTRDVGPSVADIVGTTFKPFEFADVSVTIARPGNVNPVNIYTSNGSIEYDNGMERTFLSGSRDANRTDGGIPRLSGSFEIFHEGNSWVSATYGVSELYINIQARAVSAHGLIAGVTPHFLNINIPRSQFTTNVRNFEQAALAVETVTFEAMFDPGTSTLWTPSLVTEKAIEI